MNGLFCFYILFLGVLALQRHLEFPNQREKTVDCLVEVLEKYFTGRSLLIAGDFRYDPTTTKPVLRSHYRLKRQFFKKIMSLSKWSFHIYDLEKSVYLPSSLRFKRLNDCLFLIHEFTLDDDVIFDKETYSLMRNPLWDPTGRNIIVVSVFSHGGNNEEISRKIIKKFWENSKSANNLVAILLKNNTINFYTWFPFKKPDCTRVNLVHHLDTFQDGSFELNNDLFPEKVTDDLEGCEVTVAVKNCIPYIIPSNQDPGQFVDGLEIQLLQTLAKKLNFRIRYIFLDNVWNPITDDSAIKALHLLMDQKVDVAMSCLMLTQKCFEVARPLQPYFYDVLVWFSPEPITITHAIDLIYSFKFELWLAIVLVLIMTTFVTALIKCREHNFKAQGWSTSVTMFFKVFGMSLYSSVVLSTKQPVFRLFIFLFYIYSAHITTSFQASLFASFRGPRTQKVYSSLQEALSKDSFVYLLSAFRYIYNESDHELWNKILRPGRYRFFDDFNEAIDNITISNNAIALYIESAGLYKNYKSVGSSQNYNCYWLKKPFSSYPITMYLSPGNPLFDNFNNKVTGIVSSGLTSFWVRNLLLEEMKFKINSNVFEVGEMPLGWAHLAGAFLILVNMAGFGIFVFFAEIVVSKLKKKKEIKKKKSRRWVNISSKRTDTLSVVK